jgi:hypothetical protein
MPSGRLVRLSQLAGLFRGRPEEPPSAVPFRIRCTCGQIVTGSRRPRFQVVRCPKCGAELFVLPLSPLPLVAGAAAVSAVAPPGSRPRRRRLLAVGLGLVLLFGVAALIAVLWHSPREQSESRQQQPANAGRTTRLKEAEQLLARGLFHEALTVCEDTDPASLSAADRRTLLQVRRQAALLADFSAESLEAILRHAASLPDAEWQATFHTRYQGKALVLDTEVVRDAEGHYHQGWRLLLPNDEAHLDLTSLKLLEALPLQEAHRLIFGARLGRIRREPPGAWVIRFEPDSGVLLTDPEAAAHCCAALTDAESQAVLRRQRTWAQGSVAGKQ